MNKVILFHKDFNSEYLSDISDTELLEKMRIVAGGTLIWSSYISFSRLQLPHWYSNFATIPVPVNWATREKYTFAEVTDLRAQELIPKLQENSLPIILQWSGGIDSTLMVTAILKHFPKDLIDRILVRMNSFSYTENPIFFHKVIQPNFNYSTDNKYDYTNAIILHGDVADCIWINGAILSYLPRYDIFNDNVVVDPTTLFQIFKEKRNLSANDGEWILDYIINDAKLAGVEIKSTLDVLWWANFTFQFDIMCKKHIDDIDINRISSEALQSYKNNFIIWFANDLYQIWSLQTQATGEKFDGNIRNYKADAKAYIYDFDKNQYYRDYKTKVKSPYRYKKIITSPFILQEDATLTFAT